MSNDLSHLARHRFRRKKGDTAQLAAQLAPLEEQNKNAGKQDGDAGAGLRHPMVHQEPGAIVVETNGLDLSKDLEQVREGSSSGQLEPVVLVILVVMLSFIAFIAWQISQLPEQ